MTNTGYNDERADITPQKTADASSVTFRTVLPQQQLGADGLELALTLKNTAELITTYDDLKAAAPFDPSGSAGSTRLALGADIEFPGTASGYINISDNRHIEINGNGHRLTRAATAGALFLVSENASLILTGMTVDGEERARRLLACQPRGCLGVESFPAR